MWVESCLCLAQVGINTDVMSKNVALQLPETMVANVTENDKGE